MRHRSWKEHKGFGVGILLEGAGLKLYCVMCPTMNRIDSLSQLVHKVWVCLLPTVAEHVAEHVEVTANENIGEWLNKEYSCSTRFANAIDRAVDARAAPVEHSCLSLVPTESLGEFWLSLKQLDYSAHAKHGSCLVFHLTSIHSVCISLSAIGVLCCLAFSLFMFWVSRAESSRP